MLATIYIGNPDLGATGTNFMAILQAIDYSNFERFSNLADETAAKLLASFLEYEVQNSSQAFLNMKCWL